MFRRDLENRLDESSRQFPVLAVLGPRQSGKTTLVKKVFPSYAYTNLENLAQRELAKSDPSFFLKSYKKESGIIVDEVQHAPELLSYIQLEVDKSRQLGHFILTGSQNLLMSEQIAQSLAGRIVIFDLLPLSLAELQKAQIASEDLNITLFKGGYPRIYEQNIPPADWYQNYIRTYLERDVRQIKNIPDLSLFQKFLKLCAGRIGQIVNFSDLGRDCGISYHTVQSWLSILEASFVIFLLQPFHQNFNKRLIKSPKLYFYDTGIACSLLQIEHVEQVTFHALRGNLFESYVISELIKQRFNQGKRANCYFWRDQQGHEVDCVIEKGEKLFGIEIKSGENISKDSFSNLTYWGKLAAMQGSYVIYGGDQDQVRREGHVISWRALPSIPGIL